LAHVEDIMFVEFIRDYMIASPNSMFDESDSSSVVVQGLLAE
jgi:hypothetical protein